jgi:hypothetical protein
MTKYLLITLAIFAALILGGILIFWKGVRFFRDWKLRQDIPEDQEPNPNP